MCNKVRYYYKLNLYQFSQVNKFQPLTTLATFIFIFSFKHLKPLQFKLFYLNLYFFTKLTYLRTKHLVYSRLSRKNIFKIRSYKLNFMYFNLKNIYKFYQID